MNYILTTMEDLFTNIPRKISNDKFIFNLIFYIVNIEGKINQEELFDRVITSLATRLPDKVFK